MAAVPVYLGLDIGSSGTRVVAVGPRGEIRALAHRTRPRNPMVITELERDLDVERIWAEITGCLSEVSRQVSEVRSLGVCAMRQSLIATDGADEILVASGNDDLRASLHGAGVDAAVGKVLTQEAGHVPAMIFWPGKLAWIDQEAADVLDRMERIATLDSWVVGRLTGEHSLGSVSAAETGAWSVPHGHWLQAAVPSWATTLLPEVVEGAEAVPLTQAKANAIGLGEGLPVAVGVPDTHAAELGSRYVGAAAGDCVTAGWSVTIQRPLDAWPRDASTWRGLRLGGGVFAESNAGDVASGYGWISQGRNGELTNLARATDSAAERGVFTATGARVMDPASAGIGAAGLVSPIPFIDGSPALNLLGTAVLEDVAFAVRGNRERLPKTVGSDDPVRFTGGFASAPAAAFILANVLGQPVAGFPELPVAAIGAAIWGALAAHGGSIDELTARLVPSPEIHRPDPRRARDYDGHYDRWVDLRNRLESFMQETL